MCVTGVTAAVQGSNTRNLVLRREFGLAVLIGAVSLTVGVVDPGFLSGGVWRDIVVRCAPTAIVACGVMLVVVSGEIDISVADHRDDPPGTLDRSNHSNHSDDCFQQQLGRPPFLFW